MKVKSRILRHLLRFYAISIVFAFVLFTVQAIMKHSSVELPSLSPFEQWAIIISVLLIYLVGGNYLIHLHFRKKQKQILKELENVPHAIFRNLKMTQTHGLGFRMVLADLIMLDHQIVLLVNNPMYFGLFRLAEPSYMFFEKVVLNGEIAKLCRTKPIDTLYFLDGELKMIVKVDTVFGEDYQHFIIESNEENKDEMMKQLTVFNLF